MKPQKSLYSSVVRVSKTYLGPAGERFIRRQIETHLHISPTNISQNDLPELAVWSRLAFAMLTDDSEHIDAFSNDLLALHHMNNKGVHAGKH